MRDRHAPVLLCLFLALISCRSTPDSPEAQIRALIARAETAAEEKDIQTLKGLIADRYADKQGNKKSELVQLLGFHLLHNESIHLLTRIQTITFPEPQHAAATVFVAMAAREIPTVDLLAQVRADLYRIEFTAADEGRADWKVTLAAWRPAALDDFQ